jgi:hypothetical protein
MANTKRIVVYDRDVPEWHGSIIERSQQSEALEGKGKRLTLPVEPELLQLGGVAGFYRRDWGHPGERWKGMIPQRGCSMLLWVTPEHRFVHYAVGITLDREQGKRPRGQLRLSPWATPAGTFTGGIGAVDASVLELDELDLDADEVQKGVTPPSWILKGRSGVSVQGEGYLACCLNGGAEGISVTWAAITQSSAES